MRALPALVFLASAVFLPSVGIAQSPPTAAVMPTLGGHRGAVAGAEEEARTAAREFLRTEDIVVMEGPAGPALNEELRACIPGSPCAQEVRAQLGVEFLVGLTIWGSEADSSSPREVQASILDATEADFVGSAAVGRGGVATATRDALRRALRAQRRGPGPFLRIEGTEGGVCVLDGTAIGTIPLEARVLPGEHELHVTLAGHRPYQVDVTIGSDTTRTTELEVELQPEHGVVDDGSGGSVADWALPTGIALLVGGGGMGVGAVVGAVTSTGCAEGSPCVSSNELDVGALAGWTVAGGLLAATGVVLVVVAATTESPSVQARIAPTGITLEGSF